MIQQHNQKVTRKLFETYENSDVVKLLKEIKNMDAKSKEVNIEIPSTPNIRGYKLIKDPEPKPIDSIPLFTWGEIASTPNILSSRSENKFLIPQTPVRETIAHNLVNKINKKPIGEELPNNKA
jgi:hypothetical protein